MTRESITVDMRRYANTSDALDALNGRVEALEGLQAPTFTRSEGRRIELFRLAYNALPSAGLDELLDAARRIEAYVTGAPPA